MTINSLISAVDAIYPNTYSKAEKARIAYELSCQIRSEIKRLYAEYVFYVKKGEVCLLPDEILFEDIVCVYENGRPIEKHDARISRDGVGCAYRAAESGKVRVVYLTRPEPYTDRLISNYTISGRIIYAPGVNLRIGDTLVFTEGENDGKTCFVLARKNGGCLLSEGPTDGSFNGGCQLQRIHKTEVGPPHDSMYVDYLLAKLMLYQQDFETAAQYFAQFNAKWTAFTGAYKKTEPQVQTAHLRNLW